MTGEGRVKILDFGLARQDAAPAADDTHSPTLARATDPGSVLGTVGYMSPEQVRGRPADARSDIFSFGAVLHEMLTGRRAFQRDTAAETMTAILKDEPAAFAAGRIPPPPACRRASRGSSRAASRRIRGALPVGARSRLRARGGLDRVEHQRVRRDGGSRAGGVEAGAAARLARGGRPRRDPRDAEARRGGSNRASTDARAHLLGPGPRPGGVTRRTPGGLLLGARRRLAHLDQAAPGRRRGPAHDRPRPLSAFLAGRVERPLRAQRGRPAIGVSHRPGGRASPASWSTTSTWPTGSPTGSGSPFCAVGTWAAARRRATRRSSACASSRAAASRSCTNPKATRRLTCACRRTAGRSA